MLDLYREAFKYIDDVGKDQEVQEIEEQEKEKIQVEHLDVPGLNLTTTSERIYTKYKT